MKRLMRHLAAGWVIPFSLILFFVIAVSAGCNPKELVNEAVETVQETANIIKEETVKATEGGILEPYSKSTMKEWIVGQICERKEQVSASYDISGLSVTSDDVMEDVHDILNSSIEYQYMGSKSEISTRVIGKKLTVQLTFTYRKGAKDYNKLKILNSRQKVYKYIAKQIAKGKDSITFVFSPDKISKKQLNNITYAAYWNQGKYMAISPENRSTLLCGNKKTEYYVYTNTYNYKGISKSGRKKAAKMVQKTIKEIAEEVKGRMGSAFGNNEKTYREIVENMSRRISYDHELEKIIDKPTKKNINLRNNRSTYGALVKKKTVCSGYTATFKAICDELGFPCWSVVGKAEGVSHAWNMVICGGKLYYVDVTFADQDISGTINEKYCFGNTYQYKSWKRKIYKSCYIPPKFKKLMG